MNDIAHHFATDFLRFCIIYNAPAPSDIPTQMWRVQLDERMLVSDVEKAILGHTYNDDMKAYRMKQGNIANELYHQVNWKAYGDLNKSMTHRERIFNIKLQTGFLPTANRMHMFDENTSSRCLCCGHLHENITHMLYCNNIYVQEHRTCEIEKLEKWMESNHTHPDIVRVIIDTLLSNSIRCSRLFKRMRSFTRFIG